MRTGQSPRWTEQQERELGDRVHTWLSETNRPLPDGLKGDVVARAADVEQRSGRWWTLGGSGGSGATASIRTLAPISAIMLAVGIVAGTWLGASLLAESRQSSSDPNAIGASVDAISEQPTRLEPGTLPVEFSGELRFGVEVSPREVTIIDMILAEHRGQKAEGPSMDIGEPRLQGTATIAANVDIYRGGVGLVTASVRIENERGAWVSQPVAAIEFADGGSASTIVLEGQGEFDGLYAVMELADGGPTGWNVRGAILEREVPPAPSVE